MSAPAPLVILLSIALPLAIPRTGAADGMGAKPSDFLTRGIPSAPIAPSGLPGIARRPAGSAGTIASATIENLPVCTASLNQRAPMMIPAGSGGIVVWEDARSGPLDIYSQKLGAAGATEWVIDGMPVCKAAGDQREPQAVPDGAGGAIVVWQDGRGDTTSDIYAQRIDGLGVTLWANGGVPVCSAINAQHHPVLVSDGEGGAVVAWVDERALGSDVYVQRISAGGVAQWGAGGVALCTAAGVQGELAMVTDGQRGAIVVWQDRRTGAGDVYARRVNENGTAQWAVDGEAVCTAAGEQERAAALADGTGGVMVVWADARGGGRDVYGQRVNGSGAGQWGSNGVGVCVAGGEQRAPGLCGDGTGGALVVWEDGRPGSQGQDVYGQRVNGSGAGEWGTDAVGLCTAVGDQSGPAVVADPMGGAVVVWSDLRTVGSGADVYAQHVAVTGASQWSAGGVRLCDAANAQDQARVMADGVGGAAVVWRDYRAGATCDLYGQHVSAAGQITDACTTTAALAPDSPVATGDAQSYFTFDQAVFYWCGVGVRGDSGSDWDLEIYEPTTFGTSPYPTCFGGPLAGSFAGGGVDFVVGDFNIGHTPPVVPGSGHGVRAFRYSGAGPGTVEWDSDNNTITKDCGTGGGCGARSGNNWSGVLDVWDVYLFGGRDYTFDFIRTGSADIHLLLFGSTGTTGPFFAPRSARLFETTSAQQAFSAPDTGWYGVVLVNDNGLTGSYIVRVVTGGLTTGVEDAAIPATGLRAVAPNPSAGPVEIRYALREPGTATFEVLDMAGRLVARIPGPPRAAGTWSVGWEGQAAGGRRAAPGIYFVQMRVDGRRVGLARIALVR